MLPDKADDKADKNPSGEAPEEALGPDKFQPYLTPSQTPPAALLAYSIRRIGSNTVPTLELLTTINTW